MRRVHLRNERGQQRSTCIPQEAGVFAAGGQCDESGIWGAALPFSRASRALISATGEKPDGRIRINQLVDMIRA